MRPIPASKLVAIILNFRTADLCIDAVEALIGQVRKCGFAHIVIADAASGDDSVPRISQTIESRSWQDTVTLLPLPTNGGFAAGNNRAIEIVLSESKETEFVWLLNPDTIPLTDSMSALLTALDQNPSWGIVGSRLEDPDSTSQRAARRFPTIVSEFESTARFGPISRALSRFEVAPVESNKCGICDWLPGASLMIKRCVFDQIGLLDEGFFMYFEEVDFCLRAAKAGFTIGYAPQSRVIHLVGQASGVTSKGSVRKRLPKYWFDSRSRYFLRHYGRWGLLAADISWLSGHMIYRIASAVRGKKIDDPPSIIRDFVSHAIRDRVWKVPYASGKTAAHQGSSVNILQNLSK